MSLAALALMVVSQKAKIPSIARAGGIVLGLTTIQQFEKAHGKGLVTSDGETKSGQHWWYDASSEAMLRLDGFLESKQGQVICSLEIEFMPSKDSAEIWTSKGKRLTVPTIHLSEKELGVLAVLHKGMAKKDVDRSLNVRLGEENNLAVKGELDYPYALRFMDGSKPNGSVHEFNKWQALFNFDGNLELTGLTLLAGSN